MIKKIIIFAISTSFLTYGSDHFDLRNEEKSDVINRKKHEINRGRLDAIRFNVEAMRLLKWENEKKNPKKFIQSYSLFQKAIEVDPEYLESYYNIAALHLFFGFNGEFDLRAEKIDYHEHFALHNYFKSKAFRDGWFETDIDNFFSERNKKQALERKLNQKILKALKIL